MSENDIPGIYDVDTREITRLVREEGVMKAMICDIDKPLDEALKEINEYALAERVIDEVSSKKVWYSRTTNPLYNVVAIDCGIKKSLVNILNIIGCNVVVFPYNAQPEEIMKYKPDGLFISNGPGNPLYLKETIIGIEGYDRNIGRCSFIVDTYDRKGNFIFICIQYNRNSGINRIFINDVTTM